MQKHRLLFSLLLICLALAGVPAFSEAPEAPAPAVETAPSLVEAPAAEAPGAEMTPAPIEQAPNFTPNYCGDYCETPGTQTGCIDQGSSPWRRTICYCTSQHYLAC